ncbi:MAG: endonuclease/exonuclease/phosphatase family protein [Bacteroidales bacterium]|nr:endonuclease/exonuclease/phosphatase family protein [Bacteroidales bacterium]
MYHLFIPWLLLALSILLGLLLICIGAAALLRAFGSRSDAGKAGGLRWSIGSAAVLFTVIIALNCSEEVFSVGSLLNRRFMRHDDETFKVMSFNVNGGSELFSAERMKVLIDAEDPDFLYLIECAWTDDVLDALERYPFKVRTFDGVMAAKSEHLDSSDMPGARCANVSYPGLSFFLCHLASNNSFKDEQGGEVYITPDRLADASSLRLYLENVEAQSAVRSGQAEMICEAFGGRADTNCDATNDSFGGQKEGALPANASEVSVVSHPTIVMGDMNDVGGSEALRQLKKAGFRDAWWTGGFGYGATYHEPLPFRIDHIYYSPELRLHDIRILRSAESIPLSDHDALVATFSFRQP